jgi:hypothetical protein
VAGVRQGADADCIELSAALHPSLADVPAEAMLDPVANTLDLREPFDEQRAKRVQAAIDETGSRRSPTSLLRRHAARGPGDPAQEARASCSGSWTPLCSLACPQ